MLYDKEPVLAFRALVLRTADQRMYLCLNSYLLSWRKHTIAANTVIMNCQNLKAKRLSFYLFFSLDTYRECCDHKKAIDIWKKETFPIYKGELGDHPWTASILRYIAGSYKALAIGTSDPGNVELAVMYSRQALELRIKLLGVHQDTARSHVDLSDLLVTQKDFKRLWTSLKTRLKSKKTF